MLDPEKLTVKAQEALQIAQKTASEYANQELTGEHLLFAMLSDPEGVAHSLLAKIGANPEQLKAAALAAIEKLPKVEGYTGMYFSPDLNSIFELSEKKAEELKDEFVNNEHFLLAMS